MTDSKPKLSHPSSGTTQRRLLWQPLALAALIPMLSWRCLPVEAQPSPEVLAAEKATLAQLEIKPSQLMPLAINTPLVEGNQAKAVLCYADSPAWREAALTIQAAIARATGVELPLLTDKEYEAKRPAQPHAILIGHLDNHRVVSQLYRNFFVCLDTGTPGTDGYEIRTVHNPFGDGRNFLLVGGSSSASTKAAAEDFAGQVAKAGKPGTLTFGRLLEVRRLDREGQWVRPSWMSAEDRDRAIAEGRRLMFSPGQGRSGIAQLVKYGAVYHHTGDPRALEAYRALMQALVEYYQTDAYITQEGMHRYDRDFRDAWTHTVGILWDLNEESGVFSDSERLTNTNLILRLALECVFYQGYDNPDTFRNWATNQDIVHNHNTFPALGIYFVGRYLKWHYGLKAADDWLTVANGIFNGQKHSSKPLEDAAGYQWLPVAHVMIWSLAQDDLTFFEEGHAREAARAAMMVTDNAGYQAAYGDHAAEKSTSGMGEILQTIAWYYHSPEILWAARKASPEPVGTLQQTYAVNLEPRAPTDLTGVCLSKLPPLCYNYISHSPQYPVEPNLPLDQIFDKLSLRDGLGRDDAYLLLDGFGRGTHMHFDANAILRFSAGGEPLLVDGEYIRNAPKHHSSLVILRDGQSELTPAVTGLGAADDLGPVCYTRTWLHNYNGADWHRRILWRRGGYFVVADEVQALQAGDYTLRCCWRPWGDLALDKGVATALHDPRRLVIANLDGANCSNEIQKVAELWPVNRLSQQVSKTLTPGDRYLFLNLVHADPLEGPSQVTARRVGPATLVVETAHGPEVLSLAPTTDDLSGLHSDGELLLLTGTQLAVAQATNLGAAGYLLRSSAPVSLELDFAAGTGALAVSADVQVSLQLGAASKLEMDGKPCATEPDGTVRFNVPAGKHRLTFTPAALPAAFAQAFQSLSQRPAVASAAAESARSATAAPAWTQDPFEPSPEALALKQVTCPEPTSRTHGPVDKLKDGRYSSSTFSAAWPAGVSPTLTLELKQPAMVHRLVLREWHMNAIWDVSDRRVEVSSDGFDKDIRPVKTTFEQIGTQEWGANVNTLMAAVIDQPATHVRVTLTPARPECTVYLAEAEVEGVGAGKRPDIRAIAAGDLNGDGRLETVVTGDSGGVCALTDSGQTLWTYQRSKLASVDAVVCADVNGDGKCEVICGGMGAWLALLSSEGKLLWETSLPAFRGINADVKTVVGADVNGDGKPEVLAGTASWMFFAFDATGKKLWENVFYAHSATVSCAADFDGDGRDEVVAGNAYYRAQVIDDNGRLLFGGSGNIGPEQTAVAAADVKGDGLPEVVIGTDGGWTHCFQRDGTQLWAANLGDKVTRILPIDLNGDGKLELACAAESAHVFALGLDGRVLWRRALPDGVSDLAAIRDAKSPVLAAAAGSAGVVFLDAQGKVLATVPVSGATRNLVATATTITATTRDGKVVGVALPKR